MKSKYTLRVKNESEQSGSFCVYQTLAGQETNKNIYSLVWFSKVCHSGTEVSFKWNSNYSFVWSETGQLVPGVQLKALGAKDANSHPSYWIAFGDFVEGSVIDVNNISRAKEIIFDPNVYEQSFTFTKNNEWEATGMNAETAFGEGSSAMGEFGKSDIEEKPYEKSNHLYGYGSLTNPEPFDDFMHIGKSTFCKIMKVSIWSGEILDGLEVTYSNGKAYKHGCTYGACQTLEFGEDSIVGIEGDYSVTGDHSYNAISNMIITTRFGKRFGPFGFVRTGAEGKFSIRNENCHIAILFGIVHTPKEWKEQVINSIGGYYAQF